MNCKIGDSFTFPDGTRGVVNKVSKSIIGCQELDIDVNGEIMYAYVDGNGNIKRC